MNFLELQIALAILGIIYYIMLGNKNRTGWALSFVSHCLEVTILILSGLWIFASLKIAHTVIAGRNWLKWK